MLSPHAIQFITNENIDHAKWNDCITNASNGLIYGYSFYLDEMAMHWDALVLGDYEAVMPLTWNRKYGVAYLYQPFLCAQLGLFGNNLSAELLQQFLQAVPSHFRYWDVYLNHGNVFPLAGMHPYQRTNFILPLNASYEQLSSRYRENLKRNIKKSEQLGCKPTKGFEVSEVIRLAGEQSREGGLETAENLERFGRLYNLLHQKGQAQTYGILSSTNELIASCVFVFSHNRAYYILVGNHPNGRTLGASHALIDSFIKDHAGTELLLDFEGSDLRNVAFFYSSFGAREETYAGLKVNRLPFYIKWFKR